MKELLYTPYELAKIICDYHLESSEYVVLLHDFHKYDNSFIKPEYRQDTNEFILDVMDKFDYINDPDAYNAEENGCEKDSNQLGIIRNKKHKEEDYQDNNLYFKELKIKIKYINSNGFAKKKFGILLSELGYDKRTPKRIKYINSCLHFYHIEPSLKGNIPCDINKVDDDDVVIFRTI